MGQTKPVFYLLAGPNGAGKSTLHKALVMAGTIAAETRTEHQSYFFCFKKRPVTASHDSQLKGCPVQRRSKAVPGGRLRPKPCSHS
jgi:energy-coupling factor transporter ATP-binding protein EcfA2